MWRLEQEIYFHCSGYVHRSHFGRRNVQKGKKNARELVSQAEIVVWIPNAQAERPVKPEPVPVSKEKSFAKRVSCAFLLGIVVITVIAPKERAVSSAPVPVR